MLDELSGIYEGRLEPVFPLKTDEDLRQAEVYNYSCTEKFSPKIKVSKPKAVIPVFPGTSGSRVHFTAVQPHDETTLYITIGFFEMFVTVNVHDRGPCDIITSPKS